jgi:hypothetical protein
MYICFVRVYAVPFNPLKAELNPICHLLVLLGAHLIFHVSRIRVNTEDFQYGNLHEEEVI